MELLNEAKSLLKKNAIRNYCIMEMMDHCKNIDIDILNESVYIRLKGQDDFVILSAPDRKDGDILLSRNLKKEDKAFYTVDTWPQITEGRKVRYNNVCAQLYLPESVAVPGDDDGIITLTEDMAPFIHQHYELNKIIPEEYIRERIQAGPAFGIMENGTLAGWAMTHEEGTMGVLEVLPEYRRRGYAQKITAKMVRTMRTLGRPCIVHVINGNMPSLIMCKKNGMVYDCDVDWIVLE